MSISIPNSMNGRDVTNSILEKQSSAILKFFLRFRLWPHHRNSHDILHKVAKRHPYRNTQCGNMTSYRLWRWRPRPLNSSSGFLLVDVTVFRRSMSISEPNFVDISQFTAENYFRFVKTNVHHTEILLPVSISIISPQSACIRLPNFIQIGLHVVEIWRHFNFSRWRTRPLNTTSSFLLVDADVFGRSKSISKPNFVDISQFVAEI